MLRQQHSSAVTFLIAALSWDFISLEGPQILLSYFCKIRNPRTTSIFYYLVLFSIFFCCLGIGPLFRIDQ